MLVILTPHDKYAAQRVALQPLQTVSVGNSEWADVSVAADQGMAPVHFRVTADQNSAWLKHMGPEKATYLNGQPVQHQVLSDGDIILAGNTRYLVRIETSPGAAPRQSSRTVASPRTRLRIERGYLSDGVEFLHSAEDTPDAPLQLLDQIARQHSVYLVANFTYAQVPLPAGFESARDLLMSLPEQVRKRNSLHYTQYDASKRGWVTRLWGKDALMILVSNVDPEPELRASLGVFCRPSFFRREARLPQRLAYLLRGGQIVLLEAAGVGWELYRSSHRAASWAQFDLPVGD